jgi:hypothetical protein
MAIPLRLNRPFEEITQISLIPQDAKALYAQVYLLRRGPPTRAAPPRPARAAPRMRSGKKLFHNLANDRMGNMIASDVKKEIPK